ncbi:MAG: VWA domain-containing protein [Bryobacteraceae bacterium]|jgi:VWFA-related protein
MSRSAAVLLALAAALAQSPAPQPFQAQRAPETVIRINVNLVQVDAVVTDSKGKPVSDLKKEDFQILQDTKPQVITNFSYITMRPAGARTAPAAPAKGAPPPPPAKLRPAQVRRTVALVVDDLGLSFESIAQVRRSLKKFVDEQMQAGDLVAIIRTGAGMGALQQFTTDKRLLYAAIDRVKFNMLGRVGVSSFAPLGAGGMESTSFAEFREENFAVGSMGAIGYVVEGLRDLPGRKSVILFSESMRLFYSEGMNQRVLESVKRLSDAANRASVVIYTIDPRGLRSYQLTAADNTSGMSPQQISQVPIERSQAAFNSQDGMVMLAAETGGLFLHDTNDIDGAVRQAMADSEGYYLIGYHPDASTFDAKTGRFQYHRITVRVKRPGLKVRSRTGFFGTPGGGYRPVARTRQAEIMHALTSPFASGAIHLRLTALFANAAKAGSYINSVLYFDAKELKFTDQPDGYHKTVIDIVAVTFGDNGQVVDSSDRTYTLQAKGQTYEDILKKGLVYSIHHPIKKAGAYQLRVALRDATSEEVGSASQYVEVPDVGKGRLALSGVVVKEETPQAGPATEEHPEGQMPEADPNGSVAVRIFKPGVAITYGYEILNAHADSNHQPELETQTRLFRDGQQVYTGPLTQLNGTNQPDLKRLIAGGRMKLGQKITPGDYELQVVVTDKLAKEKYRTVTQSMDFEVQQ